jgi:O-antigen/teichoic acid export membrane protein
MIGFIIFAIIYWACSVPLGAWFGDKSPLFVEYYYFVLPLAFFMLYQTVFETNSNILMHIVVPRAVREVFVRVGLLVSYILYACAILSMDGFVIALCSTYAVAALINIIYVFSLKRISLKPDFSFLRENKQLARSYLLYTGFLIVSALTSVLAPTLSSFFITAQMGLQYTGIFAIATYIAVMVSIPYRSLVAITQPELAQTIKDKDTANTARLIGQASTNLLLIGGFIFLAIWINIDLIFHILPNGETYATAKYAVLLLGLGQLLMATFSVFNPALSYSKYYAFSLLNSFILTGSALLLNNALIPRYGMNGAAIATALSDMIYFVPVVAITCWVLKIQPFTRRHLWALLIIIWLFALNQLWLRYIPSLNIWFDSIARTLIIGGVGILSSYKLHLSPELETMVRRALLR